MVSYKKIIISIFISLLTNVSGVYAEESNDFDSDEDPPIKIEGNKILKKEERSINDIKTVVVKGVGKLIIEPSDETSLTVEGEENILKNIITEYNEEEKSLEIKLETSNKGCLLVRYNDEKEDRVHTYRENNSDSESYGSEDEESCKDEIILHKPIVYRLKTPSINHITTSGTAHVELKKPEDENEPLFINPAEKSVGNIFLEARGNSQIKINSMPISLTVIASGSSKVILPKISTKQFDIRSRGNSKIDINKIDLEDKAISLTIQANGASSIHFPKISARQVDLRSKSSSEIHFKNLEVDNIDITSEGGSRIFLSGNSKKANIKLSSSVKLEAPSFVISESTLNMSGGSYANINVDKFINKFTSKGAKLYNKKNQIKNRHSKVKKHRKPRKILSRKERTKKRTRRTKPKNR